MLFAMLHFYSIYFADRRPQEREKEKSKNRGKKKDRRPSMENSSLSPLPPPFPLSRCSSPSPSPSPFFFCILHYSATWIVESELIHSPLFTLHVNSEEWPASSFSTVPQSITIALLFPFSFVWATLHYSAKWTVESVSTVHGWTESDLNLNALDQFDPVK